MAQVLQNLHNESGTEYNPGQIIILFDNRHFKTADSKLSTFQTYYLDGLCRLGWATYWEKPDLEPRKLRLIWYTHAGREGHRDFPLARYMAVKDMFDSLSEQGFRPMVLGWSGENPYPMIGGTEPAPEPEQKKPKPRLATSASDYVSGHGGKAGATPHDRVMAIIEQEEEREAKARKELVEISKKAEATGYGV
ncbi:hypothetical protein BAUCODRAFT_36985 [Baudoinia panamericana UAMH 10762]|uniref:Uncharacterized protein n=1 Tax=Baudoinia panamericana (strain UAMH 10762) TaxID=717646 RepID=M2N3J4_BAUPA|nr:uncharacterized protein BAUCODRAFT_36985 [Baudoinia panamericana UAMH 10762]EMC93300.1 hypothetical protein BAUCODRAFT_36985 [Baudoinia panamericana UAMH 10762]